jgi:DNA-binding transcriptional ArsR family regulator
MKNKKEYIKIIKTLSNENRRDILLVLKDSKKPMCVNEISMSVGMSQSLASHQLKYLESRDLICGERQGQTICYELCDNEITRKTLKVIQILAQ